MPGFDVLSTLKRFGVLKILTKAAADKAVRPRMEAAIPHTVEVMTAHGKTPDKVGPRICVHIALRWLWESLLPGDIADTIRDHQDAAVWAAVQQQITPTNTLETIVQRTMEAALANLGGGKP